MTSRELHEIDVMHEAKRLARDVRHVPVSVVEIDHEEGRVIHALDTSFCDGPEFVAFDGIELGRAYPNGDMEWF